MTKTTLCFLLKDDEVLLAMKKRGFGVGKWNGVGGKTEEGEDAVECAVREVNEEIGVMIAHHDFSEVATLNFHFEGNPDWDQVCTVFTTRRWHGFPDETEEMRPQWYPIEHMPFDAMWVDDPYWLP